MGVSLSITIAQNSQNIANNTSNVTVTLRCSWTYGSYNRNDPAGWLMIDGTKYTFKSDFNANKTTTGSQDLFTKTVTITHGSTGAKTLSCSASFTTGVSAGTITASASKVLTTIPRATTPTLSSASVNMGSTVTIGTPRASSSFTHDLAYSFNGAAYVSIATGVGTSYTWTVPDLASKIPSATSGTATIRCITKNGSTTVGTKTVNMTIKVPTSSAFMPSVSAVSVAEATAGLAAQFGAYIQGKSKLTVQITAAGAKGSTIKSYKTTLAGATYTAAAFTSGVLSASGTLTMTTTVTDSRGRTASKATTIKVVAYSKPAVQLFSVYRVDATGAAAEDGEFIAVRYQYSAPSLNGGNTASMAVTYKKTTDTAYTSPALLTGAAISANTTAKPTAPTFSTDYSFDVVLTVTDYFGAKATATTQLPSGAVILDIGAEGDCLGIGETAQFPGHVGFAWTLKTKHGEIPRDALAIPGSADLDDYTTPGYYVFSSASAGTIANLPIGGSGSGSVEVFREGEATQVRQVVTRCSEVVREIWERLFYSNKWNAWRCIYKGGTGRVLWSGEYYMTAGQTVNLSEAVSKQPAGIVLVFSRYDIANSTPLNEHFSYHFVPKIMTELHPGKGSIFNMSTSNETYSASKYLYISDTQIAGHENNTATGTGATGVSYNNNRFVLRYVIGV